MLTDFAESRAEYRAWREAITHSHERKIWGRVLGLSHHRIAAVHDILDGQVTLDVTADTTRIANVRLLDPTRSLGWEPDTPASLPIHQRRMIQLFDQRMVPGFGPVSCPIFTGPVAEVDRTGAEVFVKAGGKERLAMRSFGRTHHWQKGRLIHEVIKDLLELAGELPSRVHVPVMKARLNKDLNVKRTDKPWLIIKRLVRSVDRICFYDGRGHFRMRRLATGPSLILDEAWLMSEVALDRPQVEFHNGWIVLGKNPRGKAPRISSDLIGLPKRHEFSAQSLAREGQLGWEIREEERPNIGTKAKCNAAARKMRDEKVRARAEVAVDTLPFPNVEEWDLYGAVDPLTGRAQIRVRQVTFPLYQGNQSLNAKKRVHQGHRRGYLPADHGGLRAS